MRQLFVFLLIASAWEGSALGQILFSEDFEASNATIKANFFDTSCLNSSGQSTFPEASNPGISTTRAHSGAHSIRYHYAGHQYPLHLGIRPSMGLPEWPAWGGCSAGRSFAPQSEIWVSWYEFYENGFIVDEITTKGLQILMNGNGGYFWLMDGQFGTRQTFASPNAWIPSLNRYDNRIIGTSAKCPSGQWVFNEVHIKLSVNNQPNGVLEWYEDGAFVGGAYDIQFAGFNAGSLGPLAAGTQLTGIGLYVQDGMGDMYRDDLTVSMTRLNGTQTPPPPPDTQAPSAPAGVDAQAASSSQVNLTWNASTDNIGVTGYRIFRNGTPISTSAGASYSDTGLNASTPYSYTIAAYDAAGNTSSQSAAASATTPASTPPAGAVGTVNNLSAAPAGANGVTLNFTQVDDGTGQPAKYDVRFQSPTLGWGTASSVAQGTCATPLAGTQIGATTTCTVLGLSASSAYQFQLVPFRGTPNVDAVFGPLSNVATATTAAAGGPATDINGDGATNVTDVQLGVNQALGGAACSTGDVNHDGTCNVVDVQQIVNKALGL